jgi:hypothetical protein
MVLDPKELREALGELLGLQSPPPTLVVLVNDEMTTREGVTYSRVGEWTRAPGGGPLYFPDTCGCLRLFRTVAAAAFMSQRYGVYGSSHPRGFLAETRGPTITDGVIIGAREARLVRQVDIPWPDEEAVRSRFSRLCAAAADDPRICDHLGGYHYMLAIANDAVDAGVDVIPLAEAALRGRCE